MLRCTFFRWAANVEPSSSYFQINVVLGILPNTSRRVFLKILLCNYWHCEYLVRTNSTAGVVIFLWYCLSLSSTTLFYIFWAFFMFLLHIFFQRSALKKHRIPWHDAPFGKKLRVPVRPSTCSQGYSCTVVVSKQLIRLYRSRILATRLSQPSATSYWPFWGGNMLCETKYCGSTPSDFRQSLL